jgi:hypothetical protein
MPKKTALQTISLLATGAVVALALMVRVPTVTADAGTNAGDTLAHGEYLTRIMGCNDCHTPFIMGPHGPEPDMSRMLSGHPESEVLPPAPALGNGPWVWVGAGSNTAYAGPWGVSYSSNLTPDPETGLGGWTEEIFIQALRSGRHEGQGRPILPPMPWPAYRHATDEDLAAIFAYLQTVPAIHNRVPQPLDPAGAR